MQPSDFDDAIVGAGALGLAHAYQLAMRGRRVIVFERSPLPRGAVGASIRNFGMLWPIGQPPGELYDLARRSRELWLNALQAADLWYEPAGSLHLAYRDDEADVLREFIAAAPTNGVHCQWIDPPQVLLKSSAVRLEGNDINEGRDRLRGAMWSPIETCIDPREVISSLPSWLNKEYGVQFIFERAVTSYNDRRVTAGGEEYTADNLYVCAGDDLQTLYPEVFRDSGLIRCKLQMMRSNPIAGDWRVGPMLVAGLTLTHYKAFQDCHSLPELKKRFADEMPEYIRYGIHVLISQNGLGELTIGDSHEYGDEITPFDKEEINKLVLRYLDSFFRPPKLEIALRWNGFYVKHPTEPYFIARPDTGVTVVTGVGGAGMTLSFGLAEKIVMENLGEN